MKKILKIIIILAGLLAAVYLVKNTLDIRNKAVSGGASLSFSDNQKSGLVDDEITLGIILNTGTNNFVTAVELHLSYDPTAIEMTNFTKNDTIFSGTLPPGPPVNGEFKVTPSTFSPYNGSGLLGTLRIKILGPPKTSRIDFTSKTKMSAIGSSGDVLLGNFTGINIIGLSPTPIPTNTSIPTIKPTLTATPTSTPKPIATPFLTPIPTITPRPTIKPTSTPKPTNTPIPTPTDIPGDTSSILNYQVALANINPDSAQCVVNWPLQFIVLGNGQSNVYSNVIAPNINKVGNQLVFSGSLKLTGFKKTSRVAVFIKGPKHLQMKYGKNQQIGAYGKAGGEITLTNDATTSPVYDFTKHPIIAGDIVGINPEKPDGWINGVDFSYVKSKSLIHETITAGGYLKGDLDGNCQVNSNDVNILKISLQARQGQLY